MKVKYTEEWRRIRFQNMNRDYMSKIKRIKKFKLNLNK